MRRLSALTAGLLVVPAGNACSAPDRYREAREAMVAGQLESRGIGDRWVLDAMRDVPRHLFVPAHHHSRAYADQPLPIGRGQTISQPYIVALMTELAEVRPGDRVLEIGTGSGYQAAVLAAITDEVYSIEIIPELAAEAGARLAAAGYEVEVRAGDGYLGWPEAAPFDAILVTAAAPRVPQPLLDQLAEGGRLVIPVGEGFQQLEVYRKQGGAVERQPVLPVRFVPMVGQVRDEE